MPFEDPANPPRAAPRTSSSGVHIVPVRAPAPQRVETRRLGDVLEVTFDAADLAESRFRFAVGRRYLVVWSDDGPPDRQRFVLLPATVDPDSAEVRLRNGVVDARFRLAPRA